jgi:hypothetical protein
VKSVISKAYRYYVIWVKYLILVMEEMIYLHRKRENISIKRIRHVIETLKRTITVLSMQFLSLNARAQNTSYTQLGNELQFARAINEKWAAEIYLGGTFSNTPEESSVLKTNIQRYIFGWAHYYYSPRWKFSSSLAYYYNKDVPDIGQYFSPEYRLTLQGLYFIHKIGYTLSTRMRGEFRYMMNADGVFEDKYRYRQMLKFMMPINSQLLRQGVGYFVTAEELLFKPQAKTKGVNFFDRNRFEIGGGFLITDDLQVELTYVNEFMPRDNGNELYNIVSLTVTINNLFPNLRKRISPGSSESKQTD